MKNLQKKLGVVVLSGMMVSGVFLSSGLNAHAYYNLGMFGGEWSDSKELSDVKDVGKKIGFKVLASGEPRVVDGYIESIFHPKKDEKLIKDLKWSVEFKFKSKEELQEKVKMIIDKNPDKKVIRVKMPESDYIIRFEKPRGIKDIEKNERELVKKYGSMFDYEVGPIVEAKADVDLKFNDVNEFVLSLKQNREKFKEEKHKYHAFGDYYVIVVIGENSYHIKFK